jgi:hypothetical protein
MALLSQVAIVSESPTVTFDEVARVSAAIQKQVARDLESCWDVRATVDAFATLDEVPGGYWPVIVRDDIGRDSAGAHCDHQGQPMALVTAEPAQLWSLTASHEVLEMLVDPFQNRLVAGQSPEIGQGRVEFLVEVADPVSDRQFAYTVNGLMVSDFYTPHYFDPVAASGVQYSFKGALREPRQVLTGGYLSWHDSVSGEWWQQSWFGGDAPIIRSIGQLQPECGLRSAIDRKTEQYRMSVEPGRPASSAQDASKDRFELARDAVVHSARCKAEAWRRRIHEIAQRK